MSPIYRTSGTCCCGGCPPLYITVQGMQTVINQTGASWHAEWTFPTSSLAGIAVPAKYLATAQYVPFVKRASTNWFPQTSWANWLCVANGQIIIQSDVVIQQNVPQSSLWTDGVMTFVFVCDSSQFSAAESAFQTTLAAHIAKTMGTLTTL